MPVDELESADATLAVLQHVLHGIGSEHESRQTPCREFNVGQLTDHLLNSITLIGGAAGAEFPERDTNSSVEKQVMDAARPAMEAWHKRGLEGTVKIGPNEGPAKVFAGILSIEFLVHAWDYANATGQVVEAPDELSDYVFGLSRTIITDRSGPGFDDPVDVAEDAATLDRLIAFTGRQPVTQTR
ncbi:MAG: TIGR03086 family protein [Mycobacteriaceae bacterium]|nr:TIGR03086 family protein [Mycobacteriaceae bacterium]